VPHTIEACKMAARGSSKITRPLRGTATLLLAASGSYLLADYAFAVPSIQRTTTVLSEVGAELRPGAGALANSHFAGRSAYGAKPQAEVHESRGSDGMSLALATAGFAVAMKATEAATSAKEEKGFMDKYGVPVYILMWYVFNIGYNIYNKKSLIAYPYPWACALWQMAFGWCIFIPLWILGVRKVPKLNVSQAVTLAPAAVGHLATHVGAVVAFFAGAVSFGHIVKASEPVISSALNFFFLGEVMPWQVYAALLPVIGGVGIASASELSFNWLCFGAAMGSNLGSASRSVYSKKVMGKGNIGENMDSANVYAVLTIMATFMLIPISLAIEGPSGMINGFKVAYAAGGIGFLKQMVLSGFYYYMYNEVAFLALGKLDPVSHAVCNTMKRVVIIIAAIFVFRTPVTSLGLIGSGVAIAGTLLYSLAKDKYS